MKSSQRQRLSKKLDQRIQELRRSESDSELKVPTGQETLKMLVGLQKPAEQETESKIGKQLILYLREGVNPANSNYTKYPNDVHTIMVEHLKDMSEGILYMYLWRESWGWGRNYCRTSYSKIEKNTLIGSTRTAQRAIDNLSKKHFIVRGLLPSMEHDVNRQGALYRILTPEEICNGLTEEGVEINEIPNTGVVMMSIDTMSNDIITIGHNVYSNNDDSSIDKMSIDTMSNDRIKADDIKAKRNYRHNVYSNNDDPLKDIQDLKNSLSQEKIIDHFYNCIGQKGVTNKKIESAKNCIEELLSEGYSLEDIQFAAEWTVKNTEKKLYDFSIIEHTISQAMSEKEEIEKREANRLEKERLAQEEKDEAEKVEKEYALMESHKAQMSQKDKDKLREQALEEIRNNKDIKVEFITDILINAKENEILKRKLYNSNGDLDSKTAR